MSGDNLTDPAYPGENTSKDWNYFPDLPLKDPSIFSRPVGPRFSAQHDGTEDGKAGLRDRLKARKT